MTAQRTLKTAAVQKQSGRKDRPAIASPPGLQNSHYNNTIIPRTPTTAANPAIPAGLSAPACGVVTFGGVTEFVGVAPAVPFEVVEEVAVLLADGIKPLETLTVDPFADTCAKPELAVTIVGADVVTTVAFADEDK